jgi:AcrR family transcriptional regulator
MSMKRLKRTRPTQEERRARTRELLMKSGREVFAKNGYAGSSVDLIAENAGYSKGAFYSNWDGKEELFLALLEQHRDAEVAALEGSLAESGTLPELFERVGEYYQRLARDLDWGLLSAEFQLHAGREPAFAKRVASFYGDQRRALGDLLGKLFAKAGRKLPLPREELAALFMGMSVGLSLQRAVDKNAIRAGFLGEAILLVATSVLAYAR